MKKIIFLCITIILLQANNFRDGMIFYKNGNFIEAKTAFLKALNKDNSMQANFMLGKIYLQAKGMPLDLKKAIHYLEISVEQGNIRAKCFLSKAYLENNSSKEKVAKLLQEGFEKNLRECKKVAKIYNIKIDRKADK